MSRIVLGIHLGHDRAACVAVDGQVRVAIAEERLSRRKHDIPRNARGEIGNHAPHRAVGYCLHACGLSAADVDLVVASTTYVLSPSGRRRNLEPADIAWQCPELSNARIEVVPHHLSHAASAALCSGFQSCAVLVVDGGGSIIHHDSAGHPSGFERTTIFAFDGAALTPVQQVVGGPPAYGNSIGDLYQAITVYLGFRRGEEGKTMGLAGFADMAEGHTAEGSQWTPLKQFRDAILVEPDGRHGVSEIVQFTADGGFHPRLIEAFGPPRTRPRPHAALDRHIAASAQWAVEEAMLALGAAARKMTGKRRLCMAGGVALNCVANGRLLREGSFEELFIQPAAGDDGAALGNALLGIAMLAGAAPSWRFTHAYLGRTYTAEQIDHAIEAQLADRPGAFGLTRPRDLADAVAADVEAGRIVALYRGGCEYGPRALGHRSILCDPRLPGIAEHLNRRVKHREAFRPFGPMVTQETAADYFDLEVPSPYMLLAAAVHDPARLPGITHVDGTARIQTVSQAQESFLHQVLTAFARRTGVSVLLNTSFNDREPIVETPVDALGCFVSTGIDVLYLHDRRLAKDTVTDTGTAQDTPR